MLKSTRILFGLLLLGTLLSQLTGCGGASAPRPIQAPDPEWALSEEPLPPPVQFVSAVTGETDSGTQDSRENLREIAEWIHKIAPLKPMVELPSTKKFQKAKLTWDGKARVEETNAFFERRNLEKNTLFLDAPSLYPGGLYQGAPFRRGDITPISAGRSSLDFVFKDVVRADKTSATFSESAIPSVKSFNDVHGQFLGKIAAGQKVYIPHRSDFEVIEAYSMTDAEIKLGLSFKGFGASVEANHRDRREGKNAQVFMMFRQVYYTVAVDPPKAQNGGYSSVGFFDDKASLADLKKYAGKESLKRIQTASSSWEVDPLGDGNENPPLYCESVSYGRILILAMNCESGSHELVQSFRGAYEGYGVDVKADAMRKALAKSSVSQFKLFVRGGPGELVGSLANMSGTGQDLLKEGATTPLDKIVAWINAGESLNGGNLPTPIGYTMRQLADNSTAGVYLASKYSLVEDMAVTPTIRVQMRRVFIKDDHDGFFRGDGDWLFMGRVEGEPEDVFSFAGTFGDNTDFAPQGWNSKDIPVENGRTTIQIRMGDEDGGAGWDKYPWDEGVEGRWAIDLTTLDPTTLNLSKPVASYKLSDHHGNFIEVDAYLTIPQAAIDRIRQAEEQ